MFERFRDAVATGFDVLAHRISTDPRYPQRERVAYSPMVTAGVNITPDTAVTIAAVWACLRYLSQTVAVLPWHVKRDGDRGPEIQKTHRVDKLLSQRPSSEYSSFQFRETLTHWALRWGNGYAEIEWDTTGTVPVALWPIHPERVHVFRDPDTKALFYRVWEGNGQSDIGIGNVEIPAEDMFHIRGFGEGPVGVNVIHYAAQSLGWARAAQIFGASFFGNGMNVGGVVMNKKPLTPAGLNRQKAQFDNLYKGPSRGNKFAFLDNDADIKTLSIEPDKAQFIATQQHLIEEVCRWFGVPPHKVQHLLRATFTNIENQGIEVVVDSISPWVKRFEDEADYKLFGQNRQNFYTKIDMTSLMRGDVQSRVAYYTGMRNIGAMTPNEVRIDNGMNTIGPDGDKSTMQSGFTTLEKIGEDPAPTLGGAAAPADDGDTTTPAESEPDEVEAMTDIERLFAQQVGALEHHV
jgi:HK97 family phage portal protein